MAIEVGEGVWFAKGWRWTLLVCLSSLLLSLQSGDGSGFVHIGNDCGEDGIVLSGKPEGLCPLKSFVTLGGVKYREAREERMLWKLVEEYKPVYWEICVNNVVEVYREYCMEAFNDEMWTLGSEEDVSGSMDPFPLLIVEGSRIGRDARNERKGEMLEYSHPVSSSPPVVEAEMETAARNPVLLMSNSAESSYLQQSKILAGEEKKHLLKKYTSEEERNSRKMPYKAVFDAYQSKWEYMLTYNFGQHAYMKTFLRAFVVFMNECPEKALLLASWADTENGREWIRLVVEKDEAAVVEKGEAAVVEKGEAAAMLKAAKEEKLDGAFSRPGCEVGESKKDLLNVEIELLRNRLTKDVDKFKIERVETENEWPRLRRGLPCKKFGGVVAGSEGGNLDEAIDVALETWICNYLPWLAWFKWATIATQPGWRWHNWMIRKDTELGITWLKFLRTDAGTAFLYNRVLEHILSSSLYKDTQAYKALLIPQRQALFTSS